MSSHKRRERVAATFGLAFCDGSWEPFMMAARGAHDLGVGPATDWMVELATAVTNQFDAPPTDAPRRLTAFISTRLDEAARAGEWNAVLDWIEGDHGAVGESDEFWDGPRTAMPVRTTMGSPPWPVAIIETAADLGRSLRLFDGELEWYADVKSFERTVTDENLRHYDYRWRAKERGGHRLIEAPKQNLKSLQRWLLDHVVAQIPPHRAAHGFRQGRSIQTYAAPHVGRDLVIRMDMRAFFSSVPAARVFGIFKTAGYAEDVAHLMTGLTTNTTPATVLDRRPGGDDLNERDEEHARLRGPHLPQGAPTSPALANLAAYRLDIRLSALAAVFDAVYTRYADDMAVSGGAPFARRKDRFVEIATDIVSDEGFRINSAKTQFRTQAQRQVLTGMVVNRHLNLHRRDFDRLKAVLHDAVLNGPVAANRIGHAEFRAHLEGRIGFVQATNPHRARKLWQLFDRITWP